MFFVVLVLSSCFTVDMHVFGLDTHVYVTIIRVSRLGMLHIISVLNFPSFYGAIL